MLKNETDQCPCLVGCQKSLGERSQDVAPALIGSLFGFFILGCILVVALVYYLRHRDRQEWERFNNAKERADEVAGEAARKDAAAKVDASNAERKRAWSASAEEKSKKTKKGKDKVYAELDLEDMAKSQDFAPMPTLAQMSNAGDDDELAAMMM